MLDSIAKHGSVKQKKKLPKKASGKMIPKKSWAKKNEQKLNLWNKNNMKLSNMENQKNGQNHPSFLRLHETAPGTVSKEFKLILQIKMQRSKMKSDPICIKLYQHQLQPQMLNKNKLHHIFFKIEISSSCFTYKLHQHSTFFNLTCLT